MGEPPVTRFLADESCDDAVVRAPSRTEYEVLAVADLSSGASDGWVIELALRERCILLAEDKDFGQFIHASGVRTARVMLARFLGCVGTQIGEVVAELVDW